MQMCITHLLSGSRQHLGKESHRGCWARDLLVAYPVIDIRSIINVQC